jgi:hypothetical protein
MVKTSLLEPYPQDLYVFGPNRSGSLFFCMDPIRIQIPVRILPSTSKIINKSLDFCCSVISNDSLSLKTDVNVPTESNTQNKSGKKLIFCWHQNKSGKKTYFLLALHSPLTKRSGFRSGFLNQVYGSNDPDPYQNVTDPEHWSKLKFTLFI